LEITFNYPLTLLHIVFSLIVQFFSHIFIIFIDIIHIFLKYYLDNNYIFFLFGFLIIFLRLCIVFSLVILRSEEKT